jgi:hypothetical protein
LELNAKIKIGSVKISKEDEEITVRGRNAQRLGKQRMV